MTTPRRTAILLLLLTLLLLPAHAAGTYTLKVPVRWGQTEARTVTASLNSYRRTKLRYDFTLEACAMVRAAEAAIHQSHTRPDGTGYDTAMPKRGLYSECVSYGAPNAKEVVAQLLRSSAGHRSIALDSGWNALGVGHAVVDDRHYWALVFGSVHSGARETTANNSTDTVTMRVSPKLVRTGAALSKTSLTVTQGQKITLPAAKLTVDGNYFDVNIPVTPTWKSEKPGIVSVSGTKATAVSAGTATLTATLPDGSKQTLKVTVKRVDLSRGTLTLSAASLPYTGAARKPTATVTLNGTTLTAGTDYKVSYSDNVNAGAATVTVTGKGRYSGSLTKTFIIKTDTPALGKAENVNGGVKLSWKATPGAAAYRVYGRSGTGNWTKLGDTTGTSLLWKGAVSGKRYSFALRTVAGVGSRVQTSGLSGSVGLYCLSAPKLTTLKYRAPGSFNAAWLKVTGAAGYQLQYGTSKTFSGAQTVTVTGSLSRTVSGLRRGSVCYIRLRAYGRVDGKTVYSGWSAVRTVTIIK